MNKAFQTAFQKGAAARIAGLPKTRCPYTDRRGASQNCITFSRAFRNTWRDGWNNPDVDPGATDHTKLHHSADRSP